MTRRRLLPWLIAAALLLVGGGTLVSMGFAERSGVVAKPSPALALTGRVVDAANVLSSNEEARLTEVSARLERDTQVQFVMVSTPSVAGQDIGKYTSTLANAWGIGSRERNDGLVLLVAPTERKVRIEVGKGMEKMLPDARCLEVIEHMLPHLRTADNGGGMTVGAKELDILVRRAEASVH